MHHCWNIMSSDPGCFGSCTVRGYAYIDDNLNSTYRQIWFRVCTHLFVMKHSFFEASRHVATIEMPHNKPHHLVDVRYLIIPSSQGVVSVVVLGVDFCGKFSLFVYAAAQLYL